MTRFDWNEASFPRCYRGVYINRNTTPGFALRYNARLPSGEQVAADTLSGIKSLIHNALTKKEA